MFIERWSTQVLNWSRRFRSERLAGLVKPLIRIGVTANHLTFLSLIAGLVAVWFLLTDHLLFVLFGILHVVFDLFDGVLARATKPTTFGAYFDTVADNGLVVLLLAKLYLVLGNELSVAAAVLYIVHMGIYLTLRGPVLFVRTLTLVLLFLRFFELVPLVVGGAAVIGLVLQVHHFTFLKPRI